MEVGQPMQLTGTNRSSGLIALINPCPSPPAGITRRTTTKASRHPPPQSRKPAGTGVRAKPRRHTSVRRHARRPDDLGRPGGSSETSRPDPIPNSAVKRLSAHGTVSQDPGESVAARPAKIIHPIHSHDRTPRPPTGAEHPKPTGRNTRPDGQTGPQSPTRIGGALHTTRSPSAKVTRGGAAR